MITSINEEFKKIYEKSGLTSLYREYLIKSKYYLLAFSIVSLASIFYTHYKILKIRGIELYILTILSTIVLNIIFALSLIIRPVYETREKSKLIDRSLIYTISNMSILAAGNLSIVRIIDRISQVESSKEINVLFTKFLANIQLYDLSPNQSLRDIISRCPSTTFNRILTGVENTIKTSSDLSSYLNYEVKQLFALKEQKIKSMLNSLTFISEIYVTVLIVAPILFIVMLTTFTRIGSQSNLLIMYLNIIIFLIIPILSAVFFIILDALIEEEE